MEQRLLLKKVSNGAALPGRRRYFLGRKWVSGFYFILISAD
jgi:hypothetical protein